VVAEEAVEIQELLEQELMEDQAGVAMLLAHQADQVLQVKVMLVVQEPLIQEVMLVEAAADQELQVKLHHQQLLVVMEELELHHLLLEHQQLMLAEGVVEYFQEELQVLEVLVAVLLGILALQH
jgi:hypothetical protein